MAVIGIGLVIAFFALSGGAGALFAGGGGFGFSGGGGGGSFGGSSVEPSGSPSSATTTDTTAPTVRSGGSSPLMVSAVPERTRRGYLSAPGVDPAPLGPLARAPTGSTRDVPAGPVAHVGRAGDTGAGWILGDVDQARPMRASRPTPVNRCGGTADCATHQPHHAARGITDQPMSRYDAAAAARFNAGIPAVPRTDAERALLGLRGGL